MSPWLAIFALLASSAGKPASCRASRTASTCAMDAVLWTDTGNFRNPHYHRATDTPDTLDYGFMREVAALLCDVVAKEDVQGAGAGQLA